MTQSLPDLCGFDTETHLITGDTPFPRLVCATFDISRWGESSPSIRVDDTFQAWLTSNGDNLLTEELLFMFQEAYQRRRHIVIQAASYDLGVVLSYCLDVQEGKQVGSPNQARELYQLVWEVLERSMDDEMAGGFPLIHDTVIREKLFNLSTTGVIDLKGGNRSGYSLADLVWQHHSFDISDSKVSMGPDGRIFDIEGRDITGTPKAAAAWRLRYSTLDGLPNAQWPQEAVDYAISDATWARKVFISQENRRKDRLYGSMNSASLQVYADLCLRMYAATGFVIDHEQVKKSEAMIDHVLDKCRIVLQANGIERPNGTVNTNVVKDRIRRAWGIKGRQPMLTDGGAISCSGEVLEELSGVDPIIDLYAERQDVIKLKTAFLPSLQGEKVWSNYDILKETGRTSSFGDGDKKKKSLYSAVNIQQIPRREGIRECFLPPRGYVLASVDYNALELCSVAQVTYKLLGYSMHREYNLRGYDLHTLLGASMATKLAPHVVEHQVDKEAAYHALNKNRKLKKPKEDDLSTEAVNLRAFIKECAGWRNFAKPVGLGYPGGLGPATLVSFAKATYGVIINEDQANAFRELWRQTYPEMVDFFRWVNTQQDAVNTTPDEDKYCYETFGFNRFRAGAFFCACANGMSMQSLSADGAKRSVCWLGRACAGGLEPSNPYSLLGDCLPMAFIHDENIIAIPDDELLTERALLISQLMVDAMKQSMPDVLIRAEPALMRKWTKKAEPEWQQEPGRANKVLAALDARGTGFADAVADTIGPSYNPEMRLLPWDDVYQGKK